MPSPISLSILTPTGYQPFDGIQRVVHKKCVEIETDKVIRKSALLHRYIVNANEVFAKDLKIGDYIGDHVVKRITFLDEEIELFDPLNVGNGELYCHDDGLISHNSFIGTTNTLIEGDTLLALKAVKPIKNNNDGTMRVYEEPYRGHPDKEKNDPPHFYVMTVDVSQGRGQDCSAISIIDATSKPFRQVLAYNNNKISPLLFPDLIVKLAKEYNNALVVVENNGPGQIVCNSVYYDYEYDNLFVESAVKRGGLGVTTTKKVKRIGCSNLKDLIESDNLKIIDAETIIELSSFEESGGSYQANKYGNDDIVMTLVLFSWFVSSTAFGDYDEVDLRKMIFEQRMLEMDDDLLDFGFLTVGADDNVLSEEMQRLKDDMDAWNL